MKITFIGGGNMASALIAGLLKNGWRADAIRVVDVDPGARERLTRELRVCAVADLESGIAGTDCIAFAVKPQQMREVARAVGSRARDVLVITIAAGIRCPDLSRWLRGHTRIIRAMPNTPALALAGMTGLYAPPAVSKEDRARGEQILGAAGTTLWLQSEDQMDAITAVSGSGPAYVFYFIEALQEAAAGLGFDTHAARTLALETFAGAVRLARESSDSAATLRARVTSKGGTTERAIAELERSGVREAILNAVRAAAERSHELGVELGKDGEAGGSGGSH